MRILAYGTSTFPAASDPGPPDRGQALFLGGPASLTSTITQRIDLAPRATAIDDGRLSYALCGWLGGFGTQDDAATLSVTFADADGTVLGSGSIGPVLAADRGDVTALVERSTAGTVPATARAAVVELVAARVAGNSNDGYADNLHFAVEEGAPPPPPETVPIPDLDLPGIVTEAEWPLVVYPMEPGWHLVGWSGATTGQEAFDFITGRFAAGFTFDPNSKEFPQFRPTAPSLLNTLDQVGFGDGVWIRVEEESTWLQPAPWWARDVQLASGFNLVLWTGPNGTAVADAFASLGSALNTAFTWNSASQAFLIYGPERPAFLNTASVLNYGDGIWIDVNHTVVWQQPALRRVGTQDAWFIRRLTRVDEAGNDTADLTTAVLDAASADLGPAVPLRFGLTFRISGETALIGAFRNRGGAAYVFARSDGSWRQQAKLRASDGLPGDIFGSSVAVSGDTALVGASGHDEAGASSGSAYVFVRSGEAWTQRAELTADDAAAGANFGFHVAISGEAAVVGAVDPAADPAAIRDSGSAYVLVRSGGTWGQQAKLQASDAAASDDFGFPVAISGETALVGASGDDDAGSASGAAYIFVRGGGSWSQQAKLTPNDAAAGDLFGRSVAVSSDRAVVGASRDDDVAVDAGSAYIFGPAPPTASRALRAGANLLGWVGAPTTSATLLDADPAITAIWVWDAAAQRWVGDARGLPTALRRTLEVTQREGLFVITAAATTIEVAARKSEASTLLPSQPGFHLVGWIGAPTTTAILLEANPTIDAIWVWDAGAQQWVGDARRLPASLRPSLTVTQGDGLFVIVAATPQ